MPRNPIARAVKRMPPRIVKDKKKKTTPIARCYCGRPLDKCDGDHCDGEPNADTQRARYCYPDCPRNCSYCFDVVNDLQDPE